MNKIYDASFGRFFLCIIYLALDDLNIVEKTGENLYCGKLIGLIRIAQNYKKNN
jgi:hypothetical protein